MIEPNNESSSESIAHFTECSPYIRQNIISTMFYKYTW